MGDAPPFQTTEFQQYLRYDVKATTWEKGRPSMFFSERRRKWALQRKWQQLKRKRNQAWDAYEHDIKAAKTSDEKQMLEMDQHHECDEYDAEILAMDSLEIERRAQQCHMSLNDVPSQKESLAIGNPQIMEFDIYHQKYYENSPGR